MVENSEDLGMVNNAEDAQNVEAAQKCGGCSKGGGLVKEGIGGGSDWCVDEVEPKCGTP